MTGHLADFSGDIPRNYDNGLGPILFADYAADIARRTASGGAASQVLETAAGSGIVTRALRDALAADARLTATDLNPDMLSVARTKLRADEKVVWQQADATALPFPDRSFDTLVCQFGVMFYPDKDAGYRHAHRMLTTGGRYLFSVWDGLPHNPLGRILHQVSTSLFPADPPDFPATPFSYGSIDPIKQSLQGAGFARIEVSVMPRRHTVTDFSSLARGFVSGSPLLGQIRQRGGISPSEVQQAVAQAMRQEFGGEPAPVPMQAIIFEAHKPGS